MLKPQINSPDYQFHLPPLGDGTFGTVYRATYRGVVDRAVKVFKPGKADLTSINAELERLSAVSEHQGIVTLHDFDLRGDVPYYVMSLHADQAKDGTWKARTLEDLCGNVDAREAGRLIDQIADAMAYLHRNQVLHCDLKPRNIMLTNETPPSIKICDFGQSRGVRLATLAGWGTPLYACPEQLLRPDEWMNGKGFLWDVYSFGVVAYRLITGKFPRLHALAGSGSQENREGTVEEPDSEGPGEAEDADERMEQFVRLLEAESDISWPARAPIDRRRKNIITRCLALDPSVRLRDMRDVRNTIFRQVQESRAVRSRNVTILFGTITAFALGASGKAYVEASRVRDANARVEARRKEAEELVNFIVHNLAEDLDPSGRAELLEHIAENAATYFSNMSSDTRTEEALLSFARVLETRGKAALARRDSKLAVDSFQKAHNLYEQLEKEGKRRPDFRTAEILEKLGEAQILAGRSVEARAAFQQALETWAGASDLPEVLLARARIHRRIAALEKEQGELTLAMLQVAKARELYEGVEHGVPHRQHKELLSGYLGAGLEWAQLALAKGQLEQAGEVFSRVVDRGAKDASQVAKDSGLMGLVAQAHHELGRLALRRPLPDVVAARAAFEKELELREAASWRESMDSSRALALAECLASLADCIPRDSSEDRGLAKSRLEQAVRYLDKLGESAALGERVDELRQNCLDQIRQIKRLNAEASRTKVREAEAGGD